MNIAIIGATGMVGKAATYEALGRGHAVDAYSRSGVAIEAAAGHSLDFNDTAAVTEIVNSHDLTIITVAGRDDYDAVKAAHSALIAARPTGRLLIVGGAGALQAGEQRLYDTPDFPAEYLTEARTFGAIYDAYHAAGDSVHWTMLAPSPLIAPGVRTGEYVSALNEPAGLFVSVEDFAVALIDEAEKPQHAGARFTVASRDEDAARG